ncbi:MAG: hypothetical protein SPG61_06105, partial [Arcanobacterium sp.]|nr:hypothetical protein [Arcanobacterium sp.]
DPEFKRINTLLTMCVVAHAAAEIANSDEYGMAIAGRMRDGDLQLAVKDGPAYILRIKDHRITVIPGLSDTPSSRMVFSGIEVTGAVLRGEMPAFEAVGTDQIRLSGFVPHLENFNGLLGLVASYLS